MKKLMCFNRIANVAKLAVVAGMVIAANSIHAQDTAKALQSTAPKLLLTGTITDASTKKAIVGASISVNAFSATITDDKGSFKLHVPSYNEDIVVTAEGYQAKQIALKQRQSLNISLLDATAGSFQENITTPFSIIPERELTASAVLYDQQGEWKRPMETIDALMQGQVAGLNSIRRSGAPGVGANLFLRGYNSL